MGPALFLKPAEWSQPLLNIHRDQGVSIPCNSEGRNFICWKTAPAHCQVYTIHRLHPFSLLSEASCEHGFLPVLLALDVGWMVNEWMTEWMNEWMGSPTLRLSHVHEKPYKLAKDKIKNTRRWPSRMKGSGRRLLWTQSCRQQGVRAEDPLWTHRH